VYYSSTRNSYYRGYNLGANPVEPLSIKAFFLDTGEVHYLTFDKTKYFYLPEALYMPVMGIFCKIKSFPKKFKTVLDFFEQCAFQKLRFNICEKGHAGNELGPKEECLFINVELYKKKSDLDDEDTEYIQEETETDTESSNVVKLTKLALLKFNSANEPPPELTYDNGPFMSSEIPKNSSDFQPNQKVIVYPQTTLAANSYYGACISIHEAGCDSKKLTRLMIHMNKFNIQYEKLDRKPILNEMIIMCEKTNDGDRYYRGKVLEIFDEICMVSMNIFMSAIMHKTIKTAIIYVQFPNMHIYSFIFADSVRGLWNNSATSLQKALQVSHRILINSILHISYSCIKHSNERRR